MKRKSALLIAPALAPAADSLSSTSAMAADNSGSLGRRSSWTAEVLRYEAPRLYSVRSVSGSLHFTVTFTLEPTEGGTRFTSHVDAESGLGGIFGKLAELLATMA